MVSFMKCVFVGQALIREEDQREGVFYFNSCHLGKAGTGYMTVCQRKSKLKS